MSELVKSTIKLTFGSEGVWLWPIRGWLAKARFSPEGDLNAEESSTNEPHEQTSVPPFLAALGDRTWDLWKHHQRTALVVRVYRGENSELSSKK